MKSIVTSVPDELLLAKVEAELKIKDPELSLAESQLNQSSRPLEGDDDNPPRSE